LRIGGSRPFFLGLGLAAFLLLFDLDLLLEGVLQVGRGLLEFVQAAAERLAQLGSFRGRR
jgi:hypothetical protein